MFLCTMKAIYGPFKPSTTLLLYADGMTLLKEKKSINDWWKEQFSVLLNRPSIVDPEVLDQITQKPTMNSLDLTPTMEEVEKAIKQSHFNKAPGMDKIPPEIYKAAGSVRPEISCILLINIWEAEDMPKDFRDATFILLFKNKDSKAAFGNYWGISPHIL